MRSALYLFYSGFFFLFFLWFAAVSRRLGPGGSLPPAKPFGLSFSASLMILLPLFAVGAKGYPPPSPLAAFLSLAAGFVCSEVFLAWEKASSRFHGEFLRLIAAPVMAGGSVGCDETGQKQAAARREEEQEFVRIAAPLLDHPAVERLACYRHHRSASRLEHSIDVAWLSYLAARSLSLDHAAAVRGALLHDLFFYDCAGEGPALHIFRHPVISLANARTVTALSGKEEDIIKKHMWPLTLIPPYYAESWIVCFADTCCSIKDLLLHSKNIGERFLSG